LSCADSGGRDGRCDDERTNRLGFSPDLETWK
jgi:hypothetical protein